MINFATSASAVFPARRFGLPAGSDFFGEEHGY